uniref:DUF4440 domain-containing protein n=1 Tax=mine drainage metagenome TaxID=410659 RepID=E6QJ12_9ZZZZ
MGLLPEEVNLPEVVQEIEELYPRYEQALVGNDVETLVAMFWDAPEVMRFGATENLYGREELEAFRKSRPASNLARKILRLDVVTFGRDVASVTLEFERETASGLAHGRQSQLWARFEQGWKITSAHVSLLP